MTETYPDYDHDRAVARYDTLAKVRQAEDKLLNPVDDQGKPTAAWVDQDKGLIQIPIEEAMAHEVADLKTGSRARLRNSGAAPAAAAPPPESAPAAAPAPAPAPAPAVTNAAPAAPAPSLPAKKAKAKEKYAPPAVKKESH